MKDRQITLTCKNCGKTFLVPVEAIEFDYDTSEVKVNCIECKNLILPPNEYYRHNLMALYMGF